MEESLSIFKNIYFYLRKKKYDIFDFIGTFLGNIIVLFRGQHCGDINKIKKITFDLRARIGDAVVNKPLIILFSKYLKEELGLNIEILVETNEYNDFVFRDENFGKYYTLQKFKNEEDVHMTFIRYVKLWLFNIKSKKNKDRTLVYFSFVPSHIKKNAGIGISANLYLDNYLLDFSLRRSFNGYSMNVLSITTNILVKYFKIQGFLDYLDKNINVFYQNYNELNKSGVLIFVGNKGFRNLTVEKRYKLILGLSEYYKRENLFIMDDNTNSMYYRLQNYKYLNNVHFIKNSFSIDEFKNYAKNFKLIIGGDGGGFNYVRTTTNTVGIYTVADPNKRHVFVGSNIYEKIKFSNNYYGCRIDLGDKKFGYIYKESKILPSYDYPVGNGYFNDFPVNDFIKFIKFFL